MGEASNIAGGFIGCLNGLANALQALTQQRRPAALQVLQLLAPQPGHDLTLEQAVTCSGFGTVPPWGL